MEDKENSIEKKNEDGLKRNYDVPVITIYILGHALGSITQPVVYVRSSNLDYDDNLLPGPDPFIGGPAQDSIFVQIPRLTGRTRNRLERLLSVFNQEYRQPGNGHYLEIDEEHSDEEVKCVVHRLLKAAAEPNVRHAMEMEDESSISR